MALIEFQNNTAPYLNAENLNNNFNYLDEKAQDIYSLDEVVIGKWINGKPIYRKVIDFGSLPNSDIKTVPLNINNLDNVIKLFAIATTGTVIRCLPASSPIGEAYNIDIDINGTNIEIRTGIDRSSYTAYIIVEYTKTTDEGDE